MKTLEVHIVKHLQNDEVVYKAKEANEVINELAKDLRIAQNGLTEITAKAEQYWDEKVALENLLNKADAILDPAYEILPDSYDEEIDDFLNARMKYDKEKHDRDDEN